MLPYKFYDGGCLWFVIMSHKSTALFLGMVKHGRKKVTYGIDIIVYLVVASNFRESI